MKPLGITIKKVFNSVRLLITLPLGVIKKLAFPNIWIITERPGQARDNGYVFYKYMRNQHPSQLVYYVMDKKSKDYDKIRALGNSIQFDSWKHYIYFCASSLHISSHIGGCNPTNTPFARYARRLLRIKSVFLPHGVSYGVSEFCLAKYCNVDLFICSGKPEYDNVLKNYGYTKEQVVCTGFPRLDEWHEISVNSRQIVLMPTWRLYLAQNQNTVFENTQYYKAYNELINCGELSHFLMENDLKLVFYLHHEMRKYVDYFQTDCSNIEIVDKDETYDIQELLKESALLITDYSSVHFDFAYMGKPVLYYQFDREEFWEKQYRQSDFDAAKDGFGPVAYVKDELLINIKQAYESGFKLDGIYEQRMKNFYNMRDKHNCDRVYKEIIKIM